VHQVRADWELAANTALELAGARERVDCRSYAEQDKDKPAHERRIPQIHLGVQTLVLERKGIVTSRRQRWMEIEAERARELAARQAEARAQRQREHMEALRGRMKPKPAPERPTPEPENPFEPDTLPSPQAREVVDAKKIMPEFKKSYALESAKVVVELAHQFVFEGTVLDQPPTRIDGKDYLIVENYNQALIAPATDELVQARGKKVSIKTVRNRRGELVPEVTVRAREQAKCRNRSKGLDR
jgi:hypothetical protein